MNSIQKVSIFFFFEKFISKTVRAERSKIIRAKIDAAENTTVYFNTCIADAVRNLDLDLVKYAFNQMKLENIPPSEETYALLIGSCLIDYNAERALFYAEHMTNSPYINYLSPRLLQIIATIFKEVKFEEGEKIISELAAKEEITKQELRLALAKIRGHPRFKPTKEFVLK